jgi:hypothetical protein
VGPGDPDAPDLPGFLPRRPGGGMMSGSGGMMSGSAGMRSGSAGMRSDMEEMDAGMRSGGYGMGSYGYAGSRAQQLPDVQLFRFIDFNVESGKSYRYRVQLMLENPNHDVPPEFLEKEELGNEQYVSTEFSDPSGVASVPLDSRLLAVAVKSSLNLMVEPIAQVMSIHFDRETGEELAAEHDRVFRGQVGNFLQVPVEAPEPKKARAEMPAMMGSGGMEEMMYSGGGPGGRQPRERQPRRRAEPEEEVEKVDHLTEQTVLDMWGGQRLPGRDRDLTEPGMLLLLDSLGQLTVRSELDDLEEYKIHQVSEAAAPKSMDEQMMEGAGSEYGEEYEMEMQY